MDSGARQALLSTGHALSSQICLMIIQQRMNIIIEFKFFICIKICINKAIPCWVRGGKADYVDI